MKTGVDVKLPEDDPPAAMAALLQLERESRILERDMHFARLARRRAARSRGSPPTPPTRAPNRSRRSKKGAKP